MPVPSFMDSEWPEESTAELSKPVEVLLAPHPGSSERLPRLRARIGPLAPPGPQKMAEFPAAQLEWSIAAAQSCPASYRNRPSPHFLQLARQPMHRALHLAQEPRPRSRGFAAEQNPQTRRCPLERPVSPFAPIPGC